MFESESLHSQTSHVAMSNLILGLTQIPCLELKQFKRRSPHELNWRNKVWHTRYSMFELGLTCLTEDFYIYTYTYAYTYVSLQTLLLGAKV